MERLIYLDTETTGLGPNDKVVEIAWIEFDDDLNELNRVRSLIDPQMPISHGAMGVHHITQEMVADAPTMDEFMSEVIPGHFAADDKVIMVSHNAAFDRRMVCKHIPISEAVCTLRLSRPLWPDASNHKLQTLRYMLGLEGGSGAHGALQDCETGLALLRHMTEYGMSFTDMRTLCAGDLPPERMYYGKYTGRRFCEIPRGYLVWLLGTGLDNDLRVAVDKALNKDEQKQKESL